MVEAPLSCHCIRPLEGSYSKIYISDQLLVTTALNNLDMDPIVQADRRGGNHSHQEDEKKYYPARSCSNTGEFKEVSLTKKIRKQTEIDPVSLTLETSFQLVTWPDFCAKPCGSERRRVAVTSMARRS
ncbi:hypothetical protein RRG08_027506 [Elysia crispata]|uniref:Uncharacterized protein n=1 Tax=Elysia crispata TaxID=231223 RepID=A0AAE0YRI5_9GAST|nr:hypothetical protein RRG08_027506 [Elysia crispata]